jgi:hypothetical protein
LDHEYYITTAGVRHKIAQNGRPYGRPATVYDRVQHWAPEAWLAGVARLRPCKARLEILNAATAMDCAIDLTSLETLLWGKNN